jgi:hypothetical protein
MRAYKPPTTLPAFGGTPFAKGDFPCFKMVRVQVCKDSPLRKGVDSLFCESGGCSTIVRGFCKT